jgi:hypothetical protein
MALQDYAILYIFVDGKAQGQVTKVSFQTDGGKNVVFTMKEGFAGFSPGPGKVTFVIDFAVPVGGLEENFQRYAAKMGNHTLQLGCGPQAYKGNGQFTDCTITGGTGEVTNGTTTWVGQKGELK